ncbi:MAG: hypothetical protein SFV51_02775 [Bryobacteraceae bacterium]|nr:hypothetical protein [Bryobacteraceae bacterium]
MSTRIVKSVWAAVKNLDPDSVQRESEQDVLIGLRTTSADAAAEIEHFLCPASLSPDRRMESLQRVYRPGEPGSPATFDIEIYEAGMRRPNGAFGFQPGHEDRTVRAILAAREDLHLPLARHFPPFRKPVVDAIIHKVARENALFSLATALPDIIPSVMMLPWAVGQFASDTAVLTANQVRMAFLIAAASDHEVGYSHQKGEIGSIMAGAFGWRAIARQLIGKIPMGGGLIPKAAIAYAGTLVAGRVMEKLYRDGYTYTKEERQDAYESAYEAGKRVAAELVEGFRSKTT